MAAASEANLTSRRLFHKSETLRNAQKDDGLRTVLLSSISVVLHVVAPTVVPLFLDDDTRREKGDTGIFVVFGFPVFSSLFFLLVFFFSLVTSSSRWSSVRNKAEPPQPSDFSPSE